MKINLSRSAVRLEGQQHISIVDGRGARIACRSGSVWITQDRDAADVLLAAGESFTLDRNGVAVIQALSTAEIVLDAQCRDGKTVARSINLTALAVLGFARRLRSAARPRRPLPTMESSGRGTALAMSGFAHRHDAPRRRDASLSFS